MYASIQGMEHTRKGVIHHDAALNNDVVLNI